MANDEREVTDAMTKLGAVAGGSEHPMQGVDPARAIELAGVLLEFTLVMEQLGWRVWRELSPNSGLKRPPDFKGDVAKYLSGDASVNIESVREQVDRLRRVLAGLTSAAPRTGELYASRQVQQLSPAGVEAAAMRGTVPVIGDRKDTACWRKYQELAKGMETDAMTRELLTLWGETAEKILSGGAR